MTDRRLIRDPTLIKRKSKMQIAVPVANLLRRPDGPRDRQLIFGQTVTVFDQSAGWAYVQANRDGYCGYLSATTLAPAEHPTHYISAAATHIYQTPDFKSPDLDTLTFSSEIRVTGTVGAYAQTARGFIPLTHLSPIGTCQSDPAMVAAMFLETPYLWGGNSRWGIDCSGLVQVALQACGVSCPGDSDQQQTLGQAASGSFLRNDLLFWKGHVALVTGPDQIIHANAASMTTRLEGISEATERIKAQGDGDMTGHKRLPQFC